MFVFTFMLEVVSLPADEAMIVSVAPGIARSVVVFAVEDASFTLDDDDDPRSNGGGGVIVASSGGNRFEARRIRSGGIVSRLCLKTYFAMAEAKIAG